MNELNVVIKGFPFNFVDVDQAEMFFHEINKSYRNFIEGQRTAEEDIPSISLILEYDLEVYNDKSGLHNELDYHYAWHLYVLDTESFRSPDDQWGWEIDGVPTNIPPETVMFLYEHYTDGIHEEYVEEMNIAFNLLNLVYVDEFDNVKNIPICEVW